MIQVYIILQGLVPARLVITIKCQIEITYLLHQQIASFYIAVSNKGTKETDDINRPNKTVECKECGKVFKWSRNLLAHVQLMHQREVRYRCRICPLTFLRRKSYIKHHKSKHSEAPEPWCKVSWYINIFINNFKVEHFKFTNLFYFQKYLMFNEFNILWRSGRNS